MLEIFFGMAGEVATALLPWPAYFVAIVFSTLSELVFDLWGLLQVVKGVSSRSLAKNA
jgi:hypothetical protein